MVCNVVKLCEDELKTSIEGGSDDTYFVSLLCLILPSLLQLLRCINSLWKGQIACNLFEELEKAKSPMNEDLKTTELLEEIRDRGYNVLGLCMSLEGAFAELLDSLRFIIAFVDFNSMEFRHLRKVILAVFIPLVRHCPKEVWKEWMLEFLIPVLRHCQELLYSAWFSLLYEGRAKVPYYFGKISEELEHSILLHFTRAVCQLLSNMTPLESSNQKIITHQDLECISSNSLVGYLLVHDCFWSLRMSLVGYWMDGEAARDGIHFCRALIRLAGATKDERLQLFLMDELLPSLIKCIDDELPCAFRKLNSRVSDDVEKDLIILCRELYNYLSSNLDAQIQDIVEEDKDVESAADNFTCWLAKQKKDLRTKAHHPPKEFIDRKAGWNWEFEDEFGRYLPLYWYVEGGECKIDDSSKGSDRFNNVIDRLEQNPEIRSMFGYDVEEAVEFLLDSLLYIWEPQYHPIIQKGHKDLFVWIIEQLTKRKEFEDFQPLAPDPEDFPSYMKPYAMSYIITTLKTSVDDLSGIDVSNCAVPHNCLALDRDLIKLSLQLKGCLTNLMSELEVEGFFDINNAHIN